MKFFRLDLLTLLISLFILNSCKNQDTIGLGINTANQLNGSLIDTSTIIVNTLTEDSVVANLSGTTKTPLAYFKDPIFGTTEANIAVDLNLPASAAYTVPTGTVTIDSALLVLKYTPGFYGDSIASKYKVNVYPLSEKINAVNYYNTKKWKYDSNTLLGTRSFNSRTNDSVKVAVLGTGVKDSVQKVGPQLRVPINKDYINSILFNASALQLSSNLIFKNNVKGLYITLDKAQTTGAGGNFTFNADTLAEIDVFYRAVNGTTIDTGKVILPSTSHASEIKHTYSTAVQTELNNQTTSRKTFYIQGLAGLRTKISFPYIKNILKSMGSDIVINHAELVITPVAGTTVPYKPVPLLTMYRYDLAHQRQAIQDGSTDPRAIGIGVFGGFYSTVTQNYHFTITAFIDDLMHGRTVDNGTFLGVYETPAISGALSPYAPSVQVSSRTVAIGSDPASASRIKLNIIYTKLAK